MYTDENYVDLTASLLEGVGVKSALGSSRHTRSRGIGRHSSRLENFRECYGRMESCERGDVVS